MLPSNFTYNQISWEVSLTPSLTFTDVLQTHPINIRAAVPSDPCSTRSKSTPQEGVIDVWCMFPSGTAHSISSTVIQCEDCHNQSWPSCASSSLKKVSQYLHANDGPHFMKLTIQFPKVSSLPGFLYLVRERSMTGRQLYREKKTKRTGNASCVPCGKCFNGYRRTAAPPGS